MPPANCALGIVANISGMQLRTGGEWLTPGWHDEERLSPSVEQPLRKIHCDSSHLFSTLRGSSPHLPEYMRDLTFVLCVAHVLKFSSLLVTREGWLHFLWNITGDTSHFRAMFTPLPLMGTCGYFIFLLSRIPILPQAHVLATSLSPKKNNVSPPEAH